MKELLIKILKIAGILLFNIMLLLVCIILGCIFFSPNIAPGIKGVMLGIIFYMITIEKGE